MIHEDIFFTIREDGVLGELHACHGIAEDEALLASPAPLHTNRSGATRAVQRKNALFIKLACCLKLICIGVWYDS
jgi:hypothetical protein